MYKKKSKRNYFNMDPLEVYDLVAKGELGKFPNNYLDKETTKYILRHIILNVCKFGRKDVCEKVNHKFMQKHHMGWFRALFGMKDYELFKYSFPEWDLKEWEFNGSVSPQFWEKRKNQREFVLWVAEKENLNLNKKDDLKKLTAHVIVKYGGQKSMKYSGGIFNLLTSVIGKRKYKQWEITKVSCWTEELTKDALEWLVSEKLHYSKEQICNLRLRDFRANDLDKLLQKYDYKIIDILEVAYPEEYYLDSNNKICLKK